MSSSRVWPMRALPDGRAPAISSEYKTRNPSRPRHNGWDIMYRAQAGDIDKIRAYERQAHEPYNRQYYSPSERYFVPRDTEIVAADFGVVWRVGRITTGWRVWVAHPYDAVQSGYFHLLNVLVQLGQPVEPGTPLGEAGGDPRQGKEPGETGLIHCHGEVARLTDKYQPIDPRPFYRGAKVLPALERTQTC